MKTTKLYIFLLISSGCVMFSSCKKFLDEEPVSVATEINFWKTPDDAASGVAGTYSLLRTALNSGAIAHYGYGDLPTEEFSNAAGEDLPDISNMNYSIGVPASSVYRPMYKLRRWDNFYRVIDQASNSINKIPAIDFSSASTNSAKNNLLGEAYFLRAFTYFYMTRIWGDVPLIATSQPAETAVNISRTAQVQVLAQCISDLKAAIPLLQYGYTSAANRAIRANRGSAFALLAHIYAWQQNYTDCAAAADSVITKGGYSLVNRSASYLTIFKGQSTEGIFEISQNALNEGAITGIAQYTTKAPYNTNVTGNAQFTINTSNLSTLYSDTTDLRRKNSFAFLGTTDPICIKYANFQYATLNNAQISVAYNNIIVFRLADIILLRAEALAAEGRNVESKTLLNQIRNAAGLTDYAGTDTDLFKGVMDERARELFLEGHRTYDLIRLAREKQLYDFGGTRMSSAAFAQGKYYWPIDPSLIALNNLLSQTPYWASKM